MFRYEEESKKCRAVKTKMASHAAADVCPVEYLMRHDPLY